MRGFTLNARGHKQLNFELLKTNVIDEVITPLDEPRVLPVHNPHKIHQDVENKTLEKTEETKKYRVVFNKCVVDAASFMWYPHGYAQFALDDQDQENIDNLISLL